MQTVVRQPTQHIVLDLPQPFDSEYVQQALAAVLYYNGRLSEKEAHTMIGKTRREFEEDVLPQFGLSVIGGTPEDVNLELQACLRTSSVTPDH